MRRKVIVAATAFLEPGETIVAAVSVVRGTKLLIRLRAAAMLMSRFVVVAITGANVYILSADALTGTRSKAVRNKYPLGSIEVRFEPGIEKVISPRPAIIGIPGSGADQVIRPPGRLHIGNQPFWVRARNSQDAWAVADAATQ